MKKLLFDLALPLLVVFVTLFAPTSFVAADASCPNGGSSKGQILQGVGETGSDCKDQGVSKTINFIVQILSFIAGAVGVIMIVVAGLRFMTSGGDSGKVAAARSALVYALIGLAVAALAQFLVHYVINTATSATG
jgi:hypothetical protein